MKKAGFTLVELSIVLVILGLLIGGVLTGQSLIRAAELRSVSTQYQRYVTAVQTFRDKYFALPGDMTNATAYWNTAATCDWTTASTTAATCNGDGDGSITYTTPTTTNEVFRFWQHLANAGLIEGNYSGASSSANGRGATVSNSPAGRISSSLWWVLNWGPQSAGANQMFDGNYSNSLSVGGLIASTWPRGYIFKPEEVLNIDTKIDDGKPATGTVVTVGLMSGLATNCTDATASTQLSANYLLTNTALSCAITFRSAF